MIARYLDVFNIAHSNCLARQLWLTYHCPDFWEKIFKIHFAPTDYAHALPVQPSTKNKPAMVAYTHTCSSLFRICYRRNYTGLLSRERQFIMDFKTGNFAVLTASYGRERGYSVYDSLEDHDDVNNVLDWARRNDHQTLLHAYFQAMLPPKTAYSDLSVEAICRIDVWEYTPLHWAILCCQYAAALSMMEKLSEAKICVNLPVSHTVHSLISPYNPDKNQPDAVTALHLAAHVGSVELIKALHDYGVDMNVADNEDTDTYSTALLWAAANGHEAAFEKLLEYKADLKVSKGENNIFHFFARHPATYDVGKVVALLLKHIDKKLCSELLNQTNAAGFTPLMLACLHYNFAFVVSLFDQKARFDMTTIVGMDNLLHMLIARVTDWAQDLKDIVVPTLKCLLNRDDFPEKLLNTTDEQGNTPILLACKSKSRTSVVAALLGTHKHKHKIDLRITNELGKNVFHLVIDYQREARCDLLLCYVKSNLSKHDITTLLRAKDVNNDTPLMLACKKYKLPLCKQAAIITIQKLLAVMDLSQTDADRQNSLHHVAQGGVLCIKVLCQYTKAPSALITLFDKKDNHGKTPLDLAKAQHTEVESIIDLILRRLDRTDTGDSVLHKAAKMGSVDCLLKVIQHIAKTDPAALTSLFSQKNGHGRTPLQTAYHYGHSAIVTVLISAVYQQCQWEWGRKHTGAASAQLLWDCMKKEGEKSVASPFHKDSKKMRTFLSQLDHMAKKREALSVDGRTEAIQALDTLLLDMHFFTARLFAKISQHPQKRPAYRQAWEKHCLRAIKKAQSSALSHHEDWACLLKNIALAVLTVGVGYAIACLVNRALTGHAVFFSEDTHSTAPLHALSASIEDMHTARIDA